MVKATSVTRVVGILWMLGVLGCGGSVGEGHKVDMEGLDPPKQAPDHSGLLIGPGMNRVKYRAEAALNEGRLWDPDRDSAVRHIRRILEEEPDDLFAKEFLPLLKSKIREQANEAIRNGDWAQVKAAAGALQSVFPDDPLTKQLLSQAAAELGQ